MSNPLTNTEWMTIQVPTNGTSYQHLGDVSLFHWIPSGGFTDSDFLNVDTLQLQDLNIAEMETSLGADLGGNVGSEGTFAGAEPPVPSEMNYLRDGAHQSGVVPFNGAAHEDDAVTLLLPEHPAYFPGKELDQFPNNYSGQFQADVHSASNNETDTATLMQECDDPEVTLTREESLEPSAKPLYDHGLGSKGFLSAPPIPSQGNSSNDEAHQHEMLPYYGPSHQIGAPGQFQFHAGELNQFTSESGQFQAEAHVHPVTMVGPANNKTGTAPLIPEPEQMDGVVLPRKESSPAKRRKKRQPVSEQDFTNLSQKERKRLQKNAYSQLYRQKKKEEFQKLQSYHAFLKQYLEKVDDVNKRLYSCDSQLDAEIAALRAARGGAGTVTFMMTE